MRTLSEAVIDTGVDYNYPDLYDNIWLNQREIPAIRRTNLTDTDGDGLITFWDLNQTRNQSPDKIRDVNGDGRITGNSGRNLDVSPSYPAAEERSNSASASPTR